MGWIRLCRADARADIGLTLAFPAISLLGRKALGFYHPRHRWLSLVFAVTLNFVAKHTAGVTGETVRGAPAVPSGHAPLVPSVTKVAPSPYAICVPRFQYAGHSPGA